MFNPASTYRIQFHEGFTFADFEKVMPYLVKLGISTIYASPVFEAAPGSMHGYDTVNPLRINPGIGTLEQLKLISKKLKDAGISWLQDIVPNHMAFHPANSWLMDVLEKGPASPYHTYFDQSLANELYSGPIMVPFLGSPLDEAVENNELKIVYQGGQLAFKYFDTAWPLNLLSYYTVLQANPVTDEAVMLLLKHITKAEKLNNTAGFAATADEFKLQLVSFIHSKKNRHFFDECLAVVNKNKTLLLQIAGDQFYRLCSWEETDRQINYRRFFTVNSLICLNIHRPEVFAHFHELIAGLLAEGVFQGLRIDHIDGLYDAGQYLGNLRKLVGPEPYIIVEKILEQGEIMPALWPVQGNTGYDFLAQVNNLFTAQKSKQSFTAFYRQLTGNNTSVSLQIEQKKAYILSHHMGGELQNLTHLFLRSALADKKDFKGISNNDIEQAIAAFMIKCPVYKYYGSQFPFDEQEGAAIGHIFDQVKKSNGKLEAAADLLAAALLKKPRAGKKAYNQRALNFYRRLMQFTGPLMAKGVEDTLMYTYNRFIDHNEVGDSPQAFGMSAQAFHEQMELRRQQWPQGMNGTSTHDTKRGEDVRARLNVLSDLGDEWLNMLLSWQKINKKLKKNNAPDVNDELFIYQTLVGAYPMPGQKENNFKSRISAYLEKTLREGKQHSSWASPDLDYEKSAVRFAKNLLDKKSLFWKSFKAFHYRVAGFGVANSLSQVMLKFTCPGVPDVYQGCEHWDLSLVDPDNRRPVDYKLRKSLLKDVKITNEATISSLWQNKFDGRVKVWLTHVLAAERKKDPVFFKNAAYIPLQVNGAYKDHVLAFAREFKNTWYITGIPLNLVELCRAQQKEINELDWQDTRIILPPGVPGQYQDLLSKNQTAHNRQVDIKDIFKNIPIALLKLEQPANERGAGILLPAFSLPSPFGIGDFGPQAKAFADVLYRGHQKYWQLLPLGAVDPQTQYSPYSSCSSMAGNVLLISPQLLADDGLLPQAGLDSFITEDSSQVDYKEATRIKDHIFETAWASFKAGSAAYLQTGFEKFCAGNTYWLNDYALYTGLKQHFKGLPWYQWPDEFKFRNEASLAKFAADNHNTLQKIKWLQFIFARQWQALKIYCNEKGIRLIGDVPFYVSYDAADVWAHPGIFGLDKNAGMKFIAGVPPDYFNKNGQLWGMPVFCWDKLKESDFYWWKQRIKKNLELFDMLRLDHFRAFASYWAVPQGQTTAINGKWETAPGHEFLQALKNEIGELPFVAEDLGAVDEAVYRLRDKFGLPGMKVLQFAFGDDMSGSPHIPHNHTKNFIVYTGTHDNPTVAGWYKQEQSTAMPGHIKAYTGIAINEKNISRVLVRLAMASVAQTAIIPLQDWLGLAGNARINTPAIKHNNWLWRLTPADFSGLPEARIKACTMLYKRD